MRTGVLRQRRHALPYVEALQVDQMPQSATWKDGLAIALSTLNREQLICPALH